MLGKEEETLRQCYYSFISHFDYLYKVVFLYTISSLSCHVCIMSFMFVPYFDLPFFV